MTGDPVGTVTSGVALADMLGVSREAPTFIDLAYAAGWVQEDRCSDSWRKAKA